MSFKKLAGVDPERAERFKKALGSNKELTELRKKMVKLQLEMQKGLEYEALKLFEWEGPKGESGVACRSYEPKELVVVDGPECEASPVGKHVVSNVEFGLGQELYSRSRVICLCCGSRLLYTPRRGWEVKKLIKAGV
jgi:hypothetical protein